MSAVRVNLLPPEIAQRARQRRMAQVVVALLVVYMALLAALHVVRLGQVADARDERDAAAAEVGRLEGELAALQEFRVLEQDLDQRNDLLSTAMGEEIAVARLLNELALTIPASTSLRALSMNFEAPQELAAAPVPEPTAAATPSEGAPAAPAETPAPAPAPQASPEPGMIGEIIVEGYSVERFAPGVAALIVGVGQVPTFTSSFATSAQTEEIGDTEVTSFTGTADVDDRAYTRRYGDGLPMTEERR